MGYVGRSMSENAKSAREMGKIPISSVTAKMLRDRGFNYPKSFYVFLCKKRYILPEYHHASAAKRLYKYYDINAIPYIVQNFNLENLYLIYRGRKTKDEILRGIGIEYVKVAISGKKFSTRRTVYLDCIQIGGQVFWKPRVAINMRNASIVKNYGIDKPQKWTNTNTKKIIYKALIYKRVKVLLYI